MSNALAGGDPGILEGRHQAYNVVVLVGGLAIVTAVLLVPPVSIGISMLALDSRGVDVTSVLLCQPLATYVKACMPIAVLGAHQFRVLSIRQLRIVGELLVEDVFWW